MTLKNATLTAKNATLTLTDLAALCARGATIHFDRASVRVAWVALPGVGGLGSGAMPKERRFVMEGPSGVHSLLVAATDLDRLNAHWVTFATDARNRAA